MERIDELGIGDLRIIQDTDCFCFGTDAVLLSDFATVKPNARVVDLCSGNGIIPILLSAKTRAATITGVEISPKSHALAVQSAEMNNISDKINFINCDANICLEHLPWAAFDTVTCNPPYMTEKWGFLSPVDDKAAARHEVSINIFDVSRISAKLLKFGGYLSIVHRCERLADVICAMREHNIEPKRLQFVHSRVGQPPKLMLIEGIFGAKPSLVMLPPLYIYEEQ